MRIAREELLSHIEMLQARGMKFTYKVNNHSTTVVSPLGKFFATDNLIKRKELSFLKSVKYHVRKNKVAESIKNNFNDDYSGIKYFGYGSFPHNAEFDNVLEVDINQAYWEVAFKLNIIDDTLYQKGLTVAKKSRLAALGSLAKATDIWEFDGKEMKYRRTDREEDVEYLWFLVCKTLGGVMYRAAQAAGKGFIFYWVDGIYVTTKSAAERVKKSFEKDGYDYKQLNIHNIQFDMVDKKVIVQNEPDDPEEDKRKYPLAGDSKFWKKK